MSFDCVTNDTHGWSGGLFATRTIVIEQPGRYGMMTSGAWLNMRRCTEGGAAELPSFDAQFLVDVPADIMGFPDPASRTFDGGVVHDVDLVAGRYQISVGIEGFKPGEAMISLWPSIAPEPVVP